MQPLQIRPQMASPGASAAHSVSALFSSAAMFSSPLPIKISPANYLSSTSFSHFLILSFGFTVLNFEVSDWLATFHLFLNSLMWVRCQLTEDYSISFSGREILLCFSLTFLFQFISLLSHTLNEKKETTAAKSTYLGLWYLCRKKTFFDFFPVTKLVTHTFEFGRFRVCPSRLQHFFLIISFRFISALKQWG